MTVLGEVFTWSFEHDLSIPQQRPSQELNRGHLLSEPGTAASSIASHSFTLSIHAATAFVPRQGEHLLRHLPGVLFFCFNLLFVAWFALGTMRLRWSSTGTTMIL